MIVDKSGTVYVAWYDTRLDTTGDIYFATRAGCTGNWSAGIPVDGANTPALAQDDPAFAIDQTGTLYLVWVEHESIYFSFSDNGGQSWSTKHEVRETGAAASLPTIFVGSAGQQITVVWAYKSGDHDNIYYSNSTDGGDEWSPKMPIAPNSTKLQFYPAIGQAPDGTLHVAWAGGGIYISRSSDGGNTWSEPLAIHDEPFGRTWYGTALTIDTQGTIYVAWHDQRHAISPANPLHNPYFYDIFMAYSQDGGQNWSANLQLNDDPPYSAFETNRIDHMFPAVTTNPAGQFFAVWWDERDMCEESSNGTRCTSPRNAVYFTQRSVHAFVEKGFFLSAVYDAGELAKWDTIEWIANGLSANTDIALQTRSGGTPVPDNTWGDWSSVYNASGQSIESLSNRYLQVRVTFATTNLLTTPLLHDVTIHYRSSVWEQTEQADFENSVRNNVDISAIPGSVQLLPDIVFPPEQRINDRVGTAVQADEAPGLAADGNSIYLAWKDIRNDSAGDIYFAHSTDRGQIWSPNIQVNDDPPGAAQRAPSLTVKDNNIYLVWNDQRMNNGGDIYFSRSLDGGQTWSPNAQVNDDTLSVVGSPTIAVGADTTLYVGWAISTTLVYLNRSDDAGQSWGANTLIGGSEKSSFPSGFPPPAIITDQNGNIYAAWSDMQNVFTDQSCLCLRDREISASRSLDNGVSWAPAVQITGEDGVADQHSPDMKFYGDDTTQELYAAWLDFRDGISASDKGRAIYFARSEDGSRSWEPTNVQVNTEQMASMPNAPTLAVDRDGVLYFAWYDIFDGKRRILLTRSLDRGATWQEERRVYNGLQTDNQNAPALVATIPNQVYLGWQGERERGNDIYLTSSLTGTTYTSGTLVSTLLDTEGVAQWGNIVWNATAPPDTSVTLYTRTGNSNSPEDDSWGEWSEAYINSPSLIRSPLARYLQYKVELETTDPYTTPILYGVSVEYGQYPLQGNAVSVPIVPPSGFVEWQTLAFTATIPDITTLTVDVLDSQGNVLVENAAEQTDLSTRISATQHSSIHLRVNQATSDPAVTPELLDWEITWRKPPARNHIVTIGENGNPVNNADVYYNGTYLTTTDHLGLRDLITVPQIDDTFIGLKLIGEESTDRDGHDSWAFRYFITNLNRDEEENPHPILVTETGRQVLTLHNDDMLILFNIVVSVEWDTDKEYLATIEDAFRKASDYLYDVTDGQMAFGQVNIYDNAQYWSDADFQISTKNTVHPYAYVGGITSDDTAHAIRVGRFWNGSSGNEGNWNAPNGYRTLIHEFGHYGLHLYDEYFMRTVDAEGWFIGRQPAACIGPTISDLAESELATNASIMYYQYKASELADSDRWGINCQTTEQHRIHQQSDWQTVLQYYNGPNWTLNTPTSRGSVLGGPSEFPRHLLPFPEIKIHNEGIIQDNSASHDVTVMDPQGQPVSNALVALFTVSGEQAIAIDQGLTDPAGHIIVYGANQDDRIQSASFDGSLAGVANVGDVAAIELVLEPVGALASADGVDQSTPYLSVIPSSDGTGLVIQVSDLPQDSSPLNASLLPAKGGGSPQPAVLVYSPGTDVYGGTISLDGVGLGTGKIQVSGGKLVIPLNSDYNLQRVIYSEANSLYAEDGNFAFHMPASTLSGGADGYATILPTGYVPGPLPANKRVLGVAYEVRLSSANTLTKGALVELTYHPEVMGTYQNIAIYRWDAAVKVWRPMGGTLDEASRFVHTTSINVGIYALMSELATQPPPSHEIYLPLLQR